MCDPCSRQIPQHVTSAKQCRIDISKKHLRVRVAPPSGSGGDWDTLIDGDLTWGGAMWWEHVDTGSWCSTAGAAQTEEHTCECFYWIMAAILFIYIAPPGGETCNYMRHEWHEDFMAYCNTREGALLKILMDMLLFGKKNVIELWRLFIYWTACSHFCLCITELYTSSCNGLKIVTSLSVGYSLLI